MDNEKTTTVKVFEMLRAKYINKKKLAQIIGISRPTLDARLSGKAKWRPPDDVFLDNMYGAYQERREKEEDLVMSDPKQKNTADFIKDIWQKAINNFNK